LLFFGVRHGGAFGFLVAIVVARRVLVLAHARILYRMSDAGVETEVRALYQGVLDGWNRRAVQTLVAERCEDEWRVVLYQNTPAQFHGRPELVESLTEELRRELQSRT
jgi:hypothetical protein